LLSAMGLTAGLKATTRGRTRKKDTLLYTGKTAITDVFFLSGHS